MEKLYIVTSYTGTMMGKIIKAHSKLTVSNNNQGKRYSHVSLCRDNELTDMRSFARKKVYNPLCAGMIKENIKENIFLKKRGSEIAVMELSVSKEQYEKVCEVVERYWMRKDELGFNFEGIFTIGICGRGVTPRNRYFCSQWVTTVLREGGVNLFGERKSHNIKPYDFYDTLQGGIIYEGLVRKYYKTMNLLPGKKDEHNESVPKGLLVNAIASINRSTT